MNKDFGSTVILTSQNSEAFINYQYDASDYFIIPERDASIGKGKVYINGLDISGDDPSVYLPTSEYALELNNTNHTASFLIHTDNFNDFDVSINFNTYSTIGGAVIDTDRINIKNRQFIANNVNIFPPAKLHLEDETSFMLIRTNPKFTGNIKLVVDISNNLFLDTFKVSDELNNKIYRHQSISSQSVLSNDIRRVFGSMPLSQLYVVGDNKTLDINTPITNINEQYDLPYTYGARLLEDDLYHDDFSLLAPLWVNSQLPDYFCIFKIEGSYNKESYITGSDLSSLPLSFLKNGKLIKTWSLKETTPLGTYLRNHLDEINSLNLRAPLFLPLTNTDLVNPDSNTWNGMIVKAGITAGLDEDPYIFSKINNFTQTNEYLSNGFERLNLVSHNLINLEYTFSDDDASLYSMARYYGLYLSDNELYKVSYYSDEPDGSINILSLDGKDSSTFVSNNKIFDSSTNKISESLSNRIFSLNDIYNVNRINSKEEISGENDIHTAKWLSKPGNNLFSELVNETSTNIFMSFNINNLLNQGEHLRIWDYKDEYPKVWEVYGTNNDILDAGECGEYCTTIDAPDASVPTIYRTIFSTKGTISDQLTAIRKAFTLFSDYENTPFNISIYKPDSGQLSLIIKDGYTDNTYDKILNPTGHNWQFQRLRANTRNNMLDVSSNFNDNGAASDMSFYGAFHPSEDNYNVFEGYYNNSSNSEILDYNLGGPFSFELYGDRLGIFVNFLESNYNLYSLTDNVNELYADYTMYMGADKWYRLIKPFEIITNSGIFKTLHVTDPNEINNNSIIQTDKKIFTIKNHWNAYDTYPVSISLMGINPVKDMDYIVYDSSLGYKSDHWYKREDDVSSNYLLLGINEYHTFTDRNTYTINEGQFSWESSNPVNTGSHDVVVDGVFNFNTFDGSILIKPISKIKVTYNQLDGSLSFNSYDSSISEESLNDYYVDPSIKGNLKYGLTIPYVTKWVGLGNDCRNNEISLMLDGSILNDSSSNFIPYGNDYVNELSYPSFKYLSPGEKAWENYIYFDVNDVIQYSVDSSYYNISFKKLMFEEPYLDVFSKLMYSNNELINKSKTRSSISYYNNFKESIDMIVNGLNLSFKLNSAATSQLNIKDWDKFRVSFISSPSLNKDTNNPIEVIINENTKTILIIWYQGSDILNYNRRNSTIFDGKNLLYDPTGVTIPSRQVFKYDDASWGYTKTQFIINTNYDIPVISTMFDNSINYDSSIISPFTQMNKNLYNNSSTIFNAFDVNNINNSFFLYTEQYNTFNNIVDYTYTKNPITFGRGIINHGYSYSNNNNYYLNKTCNLDLFKNIIDNNNIYYYVIKNDLI